MAKNCQLCGRRISMFGNDHIIGFNFCGACAEDVSKCCDSATKVNHNIYLNSLKSFEEKHRDEYGFEAVKGAICNFYDVFTKMCPKSECGTIEEETIEEGKTIEEITAEKRRKEAGVIYYIEGSRGRCLEVYEDKCIISVNLTIGSLITGNATDGQKTIYYKDVIGIQYKEPGITLGYLQLETASGSMNNKHSNFFNENSFTFGENTSIKDMQSIVEYIKQRIDAYKRGEPSEAKSFSAADELKKFKELLDLDIITKEEFDAKKKQLLGL